MNELAYLGAGGGGLTVGVLITFFVVNSRARAYIKDAMGESAKVDATVTPSHTASLDERFRNCVSIQEHVNLRREFEDFRTEQRRENAALITAGEDRARRLHTRMDSIPREVIQLLKTTKELHQ